MTDNTKCKSCGAPIRWAITEKGRRMPLDPAPRPDGNVTLRTGVGNATIAVVGQGGDGPRYSSHFSSCPNAAEHRTRKGRAEKDQGGTA